MQTDLDTHGTELRADADQTQNVDAALVKAETDRKVAEAQIETAEQQRRAAEAQREVAATLREAVANARDLIDKP